MAMSDTTRSSIRDFEAEVETNSLSKQLVYSVNQVMDASHAQVLSHQQVQLLVECLTNAYPDYFSGATPSRGGVADGAPADPGYGANFDLADEVNQQIMAVRALRSEVVGEDGRLKEGRSAREVKELISSSNTLLGSLMKFHEKIINQNRMRLIEQATIEAVKTLPEEQQEIFFKKLDEGLKNVG